MFVTPRAREDIAICVATPGVGAAASKVIAGIEPGRPGLGIVSCES